MRVLGRDKWVFLLAVMVGIGGMALAGQIEISDYGQQPLDEPWPSSVAPGCSSAGSHYDRSADRS